jgi:hypothetical protein
MVVQNIKGRYLSGYKVGNGRGLNKYWTQKLEGAADVAY